MVVFTIPFGIIFVLALIIFTPAYTFIFLHGKLLIWLIAGIIGLFLMKNLLNK
ncbi:unnamed protein product [marine sediment metagenome]|uniref:Uncharacterized protein n=1 Tax=marine sediment metagenome TaxID=412755 RepID=X0THP6_9ZZZZ